MKPKPSPRLILIIILIVGSIILLENHRRANLASFLKSNTSCQPTSEIKQSINDFIFIESVSRYLFIAWLK